MHLQSMLFFFGGFDHTVKVGLVVQLGLESELKSLALTRQWNPIPSFVWVFDQLEGTTVFFSTLKQHEYNKLPLLHSLFAKANFSNGSV